MRGKLKIQALVCVFLSSYAFAAQGTVVNVSPSDDLRAAIASLTPGDELVLAGGLYTFNSQFRITVVGQPGQPIIIRGRTGETALIRMTTDIHNVLEVQASRYLVLRNLHFTGGSHGIRLMDSDFITIEDSEIYETGDVALSANSGGTYEGLLIRRNHIHHTNGTGEGMYLGCNNNGCRVANSVIEWNYVHHTNRASVEQGDGIELKEGSYGNIIRHNVIHDTNYPGILTYSTVGNGPPNIIEANTIWNTNDYAIQSAADAIIRNNIVLGSPIALQNHQAGSPSNLVVAHNTVIVDGGGGIEVRNVVGPVVIANNAVYSRSGAAIRLISGNLGLVTVAGNVGAGGISGATSGYREGNGINADFVAGHYNGEPPIDLFPRAGSALIAAGSASHVSEYDFNGTPRNGTADAGAYKSEVGGNPGWTLAPEFKTVNGRLQPIPTTSDFSADGKSDILWRNSSTGENYLYPMNGLAILGTEGYLRTVSDLSWKVVGIGDFDGDGKSDILWRHSTTGQNYVYFMNATTIVAEGYLRTVPNQNWQVAGIGDFDGDGKDDILWRNSATGENYLYPMNGLAIKGTEGYVRTVVDTRWQVAGVGDFDGDAKADILWRHSTSGENYLYPMDGTTIKPSEGYVRTVANSAWQVKGVGDFNGDGKADVAWRNSATGENYIYLMTGAAISAEGYVRTVPNPDWRIAAVGDYDGDGKSDLLWRNVSTGENYLYPMDGTTIKPTEGYLRTVADQNWQVQNPK